MACVLADQHLAGTNIIYSLPLGIVWLVVLADKQVAGTNIIYSLSPGIVWLVCWQTSIRLVLILSTHFHWV